jgi:hypothetical protein
LFLKVLGKPPNRCPNELIILETSNFPIEPWNIFLESHLLLWKLKLTQCSLNLIVALETKACKTFLESHSCYVSYKPYGSTLISLSFLKLQIITWTLQYILGKPSFSLKFKFCTMFWRVHFCLEMFGKSPSRSSIELFVFEISNS